MDSFRIFFRFNGFKEPLTRTAPGHPTAKSSSILLKTYFSYRPRDSDCSMSLFWITDSGEGSPQVLQVDTTMDFQLPVEILGWPGLESHWQYYYFWRSATLLTVTRHITTTWMKQGLRNIIIISSWYPLLSSTGVLHTYVYIRTASSEDL